MTAALTSGVFPFPPGFLTQFHVYRLNGSATGFRRSHGLTGRTQSARTYLEHQRRRRLALLEEPPASVARVYQVLVHRPLPLLAQLRGASSQGDRLQLADLLLQQDRKTTSLSMTAPTSP